jgi:hypothetical protein
MRPSPDPVSRVQRATFKGIRYPALINSYKASFSFTRTMPQSIQVILHFSLARTPESLHHLELTCLGSMGVHLGLGLRRYLNNSEGPGKASRGG